MDSNSGSDSDNKSQSEILTDEKNRVGQDIIARLTNSEELWKMISEKQMIVHRLYAEQIKVSDKFTRYNELWVNRDYSVSENIESFHRFTEVDEQVQLLSQYMDEAEKKLIKSGSIVKDLIREMKTYIASLRQSMETVIGASSIEALYQIVIPPMDWIHRYPNPEVEMLLEEWEHLQLDDKITACLHQLEEILQITDAPMSHDLATHSNFGQH